MTVQAALTFLGQARRDEALRAEVDALGADATLDALVAIARHAGYDFTPEQLHHAHRLDWRMRWARYRG
jgi:predicted ribosomally synthesized peptide with nif11-like leader